MVDTIFVAMHAVVHGNSEACNRMHPRTFRGPHKPGQTQFLWQYRARLPLFLWQKIKAKNTIFVAIHVVVHGNSEACNRMHPKAFRGPHRPGQTQFLWQCRARQTLFLRQFRGLQSYASQSIQKPSQARADTIFVAMQGPADRCL